MEKVFTAAQVRRRERDAAMAADYRTMMSVPGQCKTAVYAVLQTKYGLVEKSIRNIIRRSGATKQKTK